MRVASARSATRASQKSPGPLRLSVDDVYKLAERTRMRTSLEARHLVLAQTQAILVRKTPVLSSRSRSGSRSGSGSGTGSGAASTTPRRNNNGAVVNSSSKSDNDKSTSPLGQGGERGPAIMGEGEGEGEAEKEKEREREEEREEESTAPPLGFVRNVRISFRPRVPSIGNSFNQDSRHYRLSLSRSKTMPNGFVTSSPVGASSSPRVERRDSGDASCQCGDVTGPGVCRECRKLRVESGDVSERLNTTFPPLTLSEKHVTSSALVRRARPDMSPLEIQEKITSGEIASSTLLFPRHFSREKDNADDDNDDDEEEEEVDEEESDTATERSNQEESTGSDDIQGRNSADNQPARQTSSSAKSASSINSLALLSRLKLKFGSGEATTPLYFMDLKHMNSKIFHGRTGRGLKVPGELRMKTTRPKDSKPLWPAFVSPRRAKLVEEPSYRAYFDPPLLAKRKQIPNPAFFAGSDDRYSLPERLPDVLEFSGGRMAITDPNTLVSDPFSRPGQSKGKPLAGHSAAAVGTPVSTAVPAIPAAAVVPAIPASSNAVAGGDCATSDVSVSVSSSAVVTSTPRSDIFESHIPVTSSSPVVPVPASSTVVPEPWLSPVVDATSESTAGFVRSDSTVPVTPPASNIATVISEPTAEPVTTDPTTTTTAQTVDPIVAPSAPQSRIPHAAV